MIRRIFECRIDGRMTFIGQNSSLHRYTLDHPLMVGYGIADDLEGFIDLSHDLMKHLIIGEVSSRTRGRTIYIEDYGNDYFMVRDFNKGDFYLDNRGVVTGKPYMFNSLEAAATVIFTSITG